MATGVTDDLQDCGLVFIGESALKKGKAVVPQRVVHVDEKLSLFASFRVCKLDFAREIHRYICSQIPVMTEIVEMDIERVVVAFTADF